MMSPTGFDVPCIGVVDLVEVIDPYLLVLRPSSARCFHFLPSDLMTFDLDIGVSRGEFKPGVMSKKIYKREVGTQFSFSFTKILV